MAEEDKYYLLAFSSTHHALEAEEILKEANYKITIIPIPPEITAGCGIAVKLSNNEQQVLDLLAEAEVEIGGHYRVIEKGLEKKITEL